MTLLPPKLAAKRCGVVKSTFYAWTKDPELDFPPPRLVKGRKFWLSADLDRWMESLPRLGLQG